MSKQEMIAQILARRGESGGIMCVCEYSPTVTVSLPLQPAARPGGGDAGARAKPESAAEHARIGSSGAARAD